MKAENIEDIYELSPMQQGLLFHTLAAPNSGVYFEQFSCTLQGNLNVLAFKQAWQQVVDRHPILRTAFYWEGLEQPYQAVYRRVNLPWEEQDWRSLSQNEQQQQLEAFLKADRVRGFDLAQAPLIRIALIRLADDTYQFVRSHHHILLDGWSWSLLWKEVHSFYEAFCQGENLNLEQPRPYRDYIAWLQQQDLSEAEVFWRSQLKGLTAPTSLGVDRSPGSEFSFEQEGDRQHLLLSTATTTALQLMARQHQLTLNVLLQGTWALLLSRYSGEKNVVFGVTSSGRPVALPEVESIVGLFLNTLPLPVQVASDTFLLPWLKQLQAQQMEMYQYEYSPLLQIQGWSEIPRSLPLFESIVVFNNYPVNASKWQLSESIGASHYRSFEKTNYPLTLVVEPGAELRLEIFYDTRRFDVATITRMLGHLKTLLESMVANPNQCLKDLPLLTQAEQHQLLVQWNDTQTDYPQNQCIHEMFETQAQKTPDAVAVFFETEQLTYDELNRQANQLAQYLKSIGVGPNVLVGICVERTTAMLVGLLGILKAGAAYVPLDPAYPQERLAFMLEDASVSVLVTQQKLVAALPEHRAKVVCLDSDWEDIACTSDDDRPSHTQVTPEDLAYVIYTSGSTGKPKGVQICHSALVNFLNAMRDTLGLTREDILLSVTTLSFDIAALELYLPLIIGAKVVLISREVASSGTLLLELASSGATIMQATPATWRLLLSAGWGGSKSLKILCGGEALDCQLANQLLERGRELWNLYGPTETTIWSAVHKVDTQNNAPGRNHIVSIGRAIANTQFYILDADQKPVPVGVAGELHIGGLGLARGYLNRAELTASKFIPNPFNDAPEARLYKTGDKARYLSDGTLEYLGRIDEQVKLRGFRIELGEIEAVLSQHPGIRGSAVVVQEDEPGNQRLVAYAVLHPEQTLTTIELRRFLEKKLPKYMVPSTFVLLEALPLTPNGKVDRRSLPAPDSTKIDREGLFVAPQTPIEATLTKIWAEVLGIEQLSIHDNFFELGGHSLLATLVVSRVREAFEVQLSPRCLFESPTVTELAQAIETAIQAGLGLKAPNIERTFRKENLPLSFAQQRLWFLEQLEPGLAFYNLPAAVRLTGSVNVAALEQSFNQLVQRHEILRTTFSMQEGQAVQLVKPTLNLTLPIVDWQELPSAEREKEIEQFVAVEAQRPFDLERGPLLRGTLLRLSEKEHILLLTMHHIISDGWSMGVLIKEVAVLYKTFCCGEQSSLPELPIQYADFAIWQRQWLQGEVLKTQLTYWKQQLDGAEAVLKLPTDRQRAKIQNFQGARRSLSIPKHVTDTLKTLSHHQGVTLFMTLLAAFKTLLYSYSRQEDILVGSPTAYRNWAQLEGLIGLFVNTLVLRTDLSGNPSFHELLARVRQVTLEAYTHQDLPFDKLVDELQLERNLSHNPLFQVWFVLQNTPMPPLELPNITLNVLETHTGTSRHELKLTLTETPEGLEGSFEYRIDLFDAATIDKMASHFQILLNQIATQPDIKLSNLAEILGETDRQQQLIQEKELEVAARQKFNLTKRKSIRNIKALNDS